MQKMLYMRLKLLLFLLVFQNVLAQQKDLTLEEIFLNNAFRQQTLESFHSMQNGDFYTVLKTNSYGTFLEKYDYRTLDKVETIVHGKDLEPLTAISLIGQKPN